MEKVIQDEDIQNNERLKMIEDRKRKDEKMSHYSKIVKETHWPEVSAKKAKEIREIKSLLKMRNKRMSTPSKKRSSAATAGAPRAEGEEEGYTTDRHSRRRHRQ
jgi:hypothetical protein